MRWKTRRKSTWTLVILVWCYTSLCNRLVQSSAEISSREIDEDDRDVEEGASRMGHVEVNGGRRSSLRWTLGPSKSSFVAAASSSASATKEDFSEEPVLRRSSDTLVRHWTDWKDGENLGPTSNSEQASGSESDSESYNKSFTKSPKSANSNSQVQGDEGRDGVVSKGKTAGGDKLSSVIPTKFVQLTSETDYLSADLSTGSGAILGRGSTPEAFPSPTNSGVESSPGKDESEGEQTEESSSGKSKGKTVKDKGEQGEKILLNYLMEGYEKDVRPVRNSSQPVIIEVGITLTQIFDMDEKNQVLTTNVWLDQEWHDEFLQWNPVDFGGLEMVRLPCHRIWLPDIVLYNNADDYTQGYMPSRAMVSFDGKVFWPPPTKFRSTCPVDVTYFPFDDQICTLKLGSWTYNGFQVDVMNRTSDVDLSNYVQNGEWELLEAELQRNVVTYSCCPEPFPDVTITLIIRRKTLYYIYNVVLPCVMLSVLTLLVFCLPPDSGEKIALGITVLLAFSVFMLAIAEKMPETSESIPLIGIYLTVVMAITSISVVVTVVVLNLHYLGPQVHPVPPWLRRFLPKERRMNSPGSLKTIRQKSWLIPVTHREPRSGSLKRSHVPLPPNRQGNDTFLNSPTFVSFAPSSGGVLGKGGNGHGNRADENDHQLHVSHHTRNRDWMEMDVIKEPLRNDFSSTESVHNEESQKTHGGLMSTRGSQNTTINYHSNQNTTGGGAGTGPYRRHHHGPTTRPKGILSSSAAYYNVSNPESNDVAKEVPSPHQPSTQTEGLREGSSPLLGAVPGGAGAPAGGNVQEDLLRSIRTLITRQEEVESQNLLVAEWRLVAQAIDKILFWIFFTVTVGSSAVFLLVLPLYKRSFNGPVRR